MRLKSIQERKLMTSQINAVAHSLGACALAYNVCRLKNEIAKIVLLAPALNQQGLLRYWFVQKQCRKR